MPPHPLAQVPYHAELCWYFTAITPLQWLQRMTQFKSKSAKHRNAASLGLLSYPVLQAADILLYGATEVPVGDDQRQHLELARDIAITWNSRFASEAGGQAPPFPLPKAVLPTGQGSERIMSLRNASEKMSKSDPVDSGRINMTDDPDTIRRKFRKAKTDALPGVTYDPDTRPERANLLRIFSAVHPAGSSPAELAAEYDSKDSLVFKNDLAEAVIAVVEPIRREYEALLRDHTAVEAALAQGASKASEVASQTMVGVRHGMGLTGRPESR